MNYLNLIMDKPVGPEWKFRYRETKKKKAYTRNWNDTELKFLCFNSVYFHFRESKSLCSLGEKMIVQLLFIRRSEGRL